MARIVFIPFPEMGHLYASFKLARSLKSLGNEICYLGIQDFEDPVRLQQFEFAAMFRDALHKGFLNEQVASAGIEPFDAILMVAGKGRQPSDLLFELAQAVRSLEPDLLVIDLLLSKVALMVRSLKIPCVLLNTQFYDPWEDPRKAADYSLLLAVPELVLCPREFDFPRAEMRENCHYVEASIDQERRESAFPWHRLSHDKPLVYCSLGSQSHLIKGGKQLLQTVIDAISAKDSWQLLLTTGTHLSPEDFKQAGTNVLVVNKAPQLDVLKRASVVITHGGFNTVKECIFFGVPMIVVPLIRDHPAVAARVVHHGLGVRGNINEISVEAVNALLGQIEQNPSFRTRCGQMGERFRQLEETGDAVRIVQTVIDGLPAVRKDMSRPASR